MPDWFDGYNQATPPDTELLAKAPHDEIYRYYLEMHIDLTNQEFDRYNNSAALNGSAWRDFAAMWNREHMPLETCGAHLRF